MNKLGWPKASLIDLYGLGTCGLMTLLVGLFVVMPVLAARDEAAARRGELAEAKAKAALLSLQVSQSNADLSLARQALAANPLKLWPISHLNNRLAEISTFCASCQLEIHDMTPGAATIDAAGRTVNISLAGSGSYRACMIFLHRLHEQFLDVSVSSFSLSGNPDDPAAPLSAQFELRWFASPDSLSFAE